MTTDNSNYQQGEEEVLGSLSGEDPMLQTDDDLLAGNNFFEEDPPKQPDVAEDSQDEDDIDEDQEEDLEDPIEEENEEDLSEKSNAELFNTLLKNNGLDIYEELPEDFSFERLAQDLPNYADQLAAAKYKEKLEEAGRIGEYIEMIQSGVNPEALNPALELEKLIGVDLNNESATEEDFYNMVVQVEMRKGNDEETATIIAEGLRNKGIDVLKEKALAHQEFVGEYVETLKNQAQQQYQQEQMQQEQALKEEHDSFVKALQQTDLPRAEKERIYDFQYNRDQLVTFTNAKGEQEQTYVTKYDLALHNIMQDPSKHVKLLEFVASGLDLPKYKKHKIENSINKQILDQLEGKTRSKSKSSKPNSSSGEEEVIIGNLF